MANNKLALLRIFLLTRLKFDHPSFKKLRVHFPLILIEYYAILIKYYAIFISFPPSTFKICFKYNIFILK